jgi:hypothetical protein
MIYGDFLKIFNNARASGRQEAQESRWEPLT